MAEIERVIKGLEECVSAGKCQDCVYGKEHPALSCKALLNDALELLKEQQKKIDEMSFWPDEYEFPETDFECLKRIFTKAKLVTAFDEYEGMFDNKIIVFLNGNELHLWFDKNTGEVQEVNNDTVSEEHMEKKYEIFSDCMFDREYGKYVPTIYQCGCCHAKVNKTDTVCWHCRSKLYFKDLENDALT